jgi:hypothetical protein
MNHPGWGLVVIGLVIAAIGLVWLVMPTAAWLGKMPGDIAIERGNFRVFFPLTTCLLLSALLTGILWLVRFFSR